MKSIMVLWTSFPTKSRGIVVFLICVSGFSKGSVKKEFLFESVFDEFNSFKKIYL
jgi:hypothetical protein